MLPWYIEHNFEGATRQMLLQAHEMRALIVLIDGIDEAAGMKEAIEDFVHKEVSVSGNRLVVTSRPEGVRLDLYTDRFIVINLLPLSDEQQRRVINAQMQGNVFFDHLMSLAVIRKGQVRVRVRACASMMMASPCSDLQWWVGRQSGDNVCRRTVIL